MLSLRALHLNWINGQADDPTDHCAHGKVELSLGDRILYKTGGEDITVSAASLYLLRTVEDDHTPEVSVAEGNWLFPCCGFSVFPDSGRYNVCCMGCNTGTDLFIRHSGSNVVLSSGEEEATVLASDWKAAVLGLVGQVERFYAACAPKVDLDNELDLEGWSLFWSEWNTRKLRALASGA